MIVKVGSTDVDVRVECVLSAPRFGPLANIFGWIQALMPLHIRPTLGQGALWGQGLQRMMEQFLDSTEYILCTDYDSFWDRKTVEELIAMANKFRDASHRGESLGLTEDEVRFYDALADNESSVRELGDETLKKIAHELTKNLKQNLTVDWSSRESVRAKLRLMVNQVLVTQEQTHSRKIFMIYSMKETKVN